MQNRPRDLFIYGTLMAASGHPLSELLRANARFIGRGHIQARLYLITEEDEQGTNTYPGALPSDYPEDRVHGEVWHITDPEAVYPALDAHEQYGPQWPEPNEFLLRKVTVTMEGGETMQAVSYLYTWDVSRAQPVPSGRLEIRLPDAR